MKILAIELTNTDAADIVHCAVEGGTNYWAEVQNYNWQEWYDEEQKNIKDLPDDYVFVEIREDSDLVDPERFSNTWMQLTKHNLEKGVMAMIQNMPHLIHGIDNLGNGHVEMDLDATSCDVVVQYALFGEVIYG